MLSEFISLADSKGNMSKLAVQNLNHRKVTSSAIQHTYIILLKAQCRTYKWIYLHKTEKKKIPDNQHLCSREELVHQEGGGYVFPTVYLQ